MSQGCVSVTPLNRHRVIPHSLDRGREDIVTDILGLELLFPRELLHAARTATGQTQPAHGVETLGPIPPFDAESLGAVLVREFVVDERYRIHNAPAPPTARGYLFRADGS